MKKLVEKKVWVRVMQDNDKRYQNGPLPYDKDYNFEQYFQDINVLKVYTIISMFLTFGVLVLNIFLKLNKIWNICFLMPMYLIYIASIVQLVIVFWRAGRNIENIEKVCNRNSHLIFSASITFMCFVFSFLMYTLLSMILFMS